MIIAVCHLGKLKLEKRLFLYECHLKPKRAFQVVYTPGFKNRSVLPKFARQRKTLHLWFKKRSRSSFLSSLSLFTPWTELCRFEFETKVKTLNYYNIQWEYKTSSLKIASFNTLGLQVRPLRKKRNEKGGFMFIFKRIKDLRNHMPRM